MYRDKTGKKWKIVLAAVVIALCVFLVWFFIYGSPASGGGEDAAASIKRAVQQSALQCYAVEGAYPPDLDYLMENYGLRVNTEDYYITYDAYAQNQMPDVRVSAKNK